MEFDKHLKLFELMVSTKSEWIFNFDFTFEILQLAHLSNIKDYIIREIADKENSIKINETSRIT